MAKLRRKKPKERVARKNSFDSLKEVINRARDLIPFKEKISSASVAIGVAVLGVIIAILITPLISPLIAATIYPAVDAEPPQISDLVPEDNIYTYNISSLSATIVDYGGSGIDQEKSYVKLSSSTSPDIEGNCSFNEDTIIFTPLNELLPDVYTATFIIYDNAKRVQEKSTRFVILENPNLETEVYETTDLFQDGTSIYGVVWKDTYLAFNFQVRNDCSSTSCENIGLDLIFPGNVLSTIVRSSRGCQNPIIDDSFSNVMFIADNKTIDNIQGDSVTIEIDKMYPQGFFSATILVDPYYEINDEGVILFTDNTGSYYGEYLHSQYGKTYKGDITGLINASPDFYFEKGQYLKKISIENKDYERLIYSLVFFDKALELGLNNSDIWVEKGECFMFFSGFPEALYYFSLANEITPNERAYYDIGLLFYKVGNFEGARYFCNQSLSINASYEPALSLLDESKEPNLNEISSSFPQNIAAMTNENAYTLYFEIDTESLFSNPGETVNILDYNVGAKRIILNRLPDYRLVYSVIDLKSGVYVADIDLKSIKMQSSKTSIAMSYSEDTGPELTIMNNDMVSEKATLNQFILQNALNQDLGFELNSPAYISMQSKIN